MAKHLLVVLANAVEGRDDEFNRWYDDRHLGDVLEVEGFEAAQRFALAPMDGGDSPSRYLALYEIETDDLPAALKRLTSTPMEISDALADPVALVATPITERRTR